MAVQLKLLPPAPPPVGLYFRPGWNDHIVVRQVLAEGRAPSGLVFEARFGSRHSDLREAAIAAELDAVLDTGAMELWTTAGRYLTGLQDVPWGWAADETAPALFGEKGHQLVRGVAEQVKTLGTTSVLAHAWSRSAASSSLGRLR